MDYDKISAALRRLAGRSELRITAAYLVFGSLWILLSDRLLYLLVQAPESRLAISMYKGWAYVAASAGLFYLLLRAERRRVERAEGGLLEMNRTLELRVAERTRLLEKAGAEAENIYNNSPCAYCSLDAEGRFLKINDTALAWLGYRREEMIGSRGMADVLSTAALQAFLADFERLKRKGGDMSARLEFKKKGDGTFSALMSARAVTGPGGAFLLCRCVWLRPAGAPEGAA